MGNLEVDSPDFSSEIHLFRMKFRTVNKNLFHTKKLISKVVMFPSWCKKGLVIVALRFFNATF